MLVVVVTVFLIVESPLAVITALHIIQSAFNVEIFDYHVANLFVMFANFCIMVSYPINFAIYCGMSRQFRETFKDIFITKFGGKKTCEASRYSQINGAQTCTNETVL